MSKREVSNEKLWDIIGIARFKDGRDFTLKMSRRFILQLGKSYVDLNLLEDEDGQLYLEMRLTENAVVLLEEVIPVKENPELKALWNRRDYRFKAREVRLFTEGLIGCLT